MGRTVDVDQFDDGLDIIELSSGDDECEPIDDSASSSSDEERDDDGGSSDDDDGDDDPSASDHDDKFVGWRTPRHENVAERSDSEEDDGAGGPLRRVGNVPKEWYDQLEHLGYNIDGAPIARAGTTDAIDAFLAQQTHAGRRSVYDDENDRNVVLSKEDIALLRRIREGTYAHADFDESDERFTIEAPRSLHPLGNASNPSKKGFVPSVHEAQIVQRLVVAIRNGWIRPDQYDPASTAAAADAVYLMWGADGQTQQRGDPRHRPPPVVSAPRPSLPGHAASYNPPAEYLPDDAERDQYDELEPDEQAANPLAQKFDAFRKIPLHDAFVKERFERCLDLYLCPRARRTKLNIDPESLIPDLPKPSTLRPFPQMRDHSFLNGHAGPVTSLSVSSCGQYLASGSVDQRVVVWEVATGRISTTMQFDHPVLKVAFNPAKARRALLAVLTKASLSIAYVECAEDDVDAPLALKLLSAGTTAAAAAAAGPVLSEWVRLPAGPTASHPSLSVRMSSSLLKSFCWHRGGDYMATISEGESSASVLIHRLSTRTTQAPFKRNKGSIEACTFHPTKPYFLVAEKRRVRIYDLTGQKLVKKLQCPARWISSIDVHPSGDHILLGTFDRRVCWYDLDLSSRPFKTLKYHAGGVRAVRYHARYPLFASGADDGSVHVFHGKVFADLMQNPLIVPVKVLHAHDKVDGVGCLDAVWHPDQPWLFSAGADGQIHMFVP